VGVAILPYDDGMFVVGHDEQGGVVLARTSIEGYASCGAAGRCVVPIDCAAEACGLPICVPATGACGLEELVDEMPCGAGQTCGAGMCGP
jgi:hypothetical protein